MQLSTQADLQLNMESKIQLYPEQEAALEKLFSGAILLGDTGSGKSYTALAFYKKQYFNKQLYIITTARKRDEKDWQHEAGNLGISDITVDSWNNIAKYKDVSHAFFIFDEQRVVGYGKWTKSFISISKRNHWILLTATPGDRWVDYMPVFIANGFYKHKTDFVNQHVEYNPFVTFPQIKKYHNTGRLISLRNKITVQLDDARHTTQHQHSIPVKCDLSLYNTILKDRWNIFEDKPIANVSELMVCLRKIVNSSQDRIDCAKFLISAFDKVIVFYNYDYELYILRDICDELCYEYYEWNGHNHEEIPDTGDWVYLVQYNSGAEAWNCIETDTIVFYSLNYSYKMTKQARGRIDRINTPYTDLHYYYLYSPKTVDASILKAIRKKKDFNLKAWERREERLF